MVWQHPRRLRPRPEGWIPFVRMRDGPLRALVKRGVRWLVSADLLLRRKMMPRPRYRLTGTCNGCGRCCEAPSVQVSALTAKVPLVLVWVSAWHRAVNGFEMQELNGRILTFRCTHYDPATKTCDSYETRPTMCRDYPVNLTHEAVPSLFDECSHRIVDRNAASLRRALAETGLAPEKLAELEKKLFLRE